MTILPLVPLILDLYDGAANLVVAGSASLTPSVQLTDPGTGIVIESGPSAVFRPSSSPPLAQILPTDNGSLLPTGWAWVISFPGVPGSPAGYSFKINSSGFLWGFTATSASPCVFTAAGSALSNGEAVVLSGSLPGGFQGNTAYYVVSASGATFSLAATPGGAALASTSAGSGTAGVVQYLSSLSPVSSVVTTFPLNPMTTPGDTIYGGTAGVPQRLAGSTSASLAVLTQTGTGAASAPPAWGTGNATLAAALGGLPLPSGSPAAAAMLYATVAGNPPQTAWGPAFQPQQLLSAAKSPALAPWWAGLGNRAFAPCSVVCIGDSITVGQGASVMDNRWLGRLRVLLNSRFPTPGVTTFGRGIISCTGTGESSFTYPVVMNGSPSKLNHGVRGGDGIASGAYQLNATGQSFVFTLNGDSADIMWDQAVAAGQFSWQVDAGSVNNVSTAGGSGQDGKLTRISLGSAGAHTVTLAWVSSTATVDGIIEYNGDSGSAIHVHDCGHYGWKTSDWVTSLSGGAITGPAGAIAALAPNAVLIMLGTNDQTQSATPASFGANLATIIADIRAAVASPPAFVLVVPPPRGSQSGQTFPWSQYAAQAWAVAAADSAGLVSVLDFTQGPRMPGPDTDAYSLWAGDHVHPDNNGHQVIADYVAAFLAHG